MKLRLSSLAPLSAVLLGTLWSAPAAADNVIFLQFEQQELVAGDADYAPDGVSWTLQWFGEDWAIIPAFETEGGQDQDKLIAAIMQILQTQWEGIDIEFVTERPTEGDYRMVTMGGGGGLLGLPGAGGWGTLDCYDDNKTSIAFVFSSVLRDIDGNYSADLLAQVISQEVAHTVGLEHLGDDPQFIMYPSTSNISGHYFSDSCEAIVGAITDPEHPEYCAQHPGCEPGTQNDIEHLLEYLGPAQPPGGETDDGGDSSGTGMDDPGTTTAAADSSDGGHASHGESDHGGSSDGSATRGTSASDGGDVDAMNDGDQTEGCSCRGGTTVSTAMLWGLPLLVSGARRRRSR